MGVVTGNTANSITIELPETTINKNKVEVLWMFTGRR